MSEQKPSRIRFRTIPIGILLIYAAGLWIFGGEMGAGAVRRYTYVTAAVPFCTAVFFLFALSLVNMHLKKNRPALALGRLELLTIYVMVSMGSALMSFDTQGALVTLMGYPTYFAGRGNDWGSLFSGALPQWLMVTDANALQGFYKGDSTFFTVQHVLAWAKPLAAWTCFIWAMLAMMLCVSTILRKAWTEHEKLSFPIVALPLAMVDDADGFFKDRLMWIGFAIAGGITLLNGLHMFYPSVPYVPIRRRNFYLGTPHEFTELRVSFYFFAIALGYLMPLDLSTSVWVFYLLFRLQQYGSYSLGFPEGGGFPYVNDQTFGSYTAIFFAVIWGLKGHLKNVWRISVSAEGSPDDAGEPIRYRRAIIGFAITSAVMIVFARLAGMPGPVALAFFCIWLALTVVLTRLRAEFGFPVHDMYTAGPDQSLTHIFGASSFDRGTLGAFTIFGWYNRIYTSSPLPHQLEGLRMAGGDARARKSVFGAMVITAIVTVPMAFLIYLSGIYHYGAATAQINKWGTFAGTQLFGRLEGWIKSPQAPQPGEGVAMGFGFVFTLALAFMRRRFANFPFHPLGYAVANSWGMYYLACPIMIGSWCKTIIAHCAGLPGCRRATMLFFGLMLGEFVVGGFWTVLGLIFGLWTYDFWP